MSRYNQRIDISTKAIAWRIFIMMAAMLAVCLYMPRNERSAYLFDLGRPWRYSQLIATYDFPVYKSDEAIRREQDSILRQYEPYFAVNTAAAEEQTARFRKKIRQEAAVALPDYYLPYIEGKLRHIYACGIISPDDLEQMKRDSVRSIRIFAQNEATPVELSRVYSPKTAYEYLVNDVEDTLKYDRRLLRKCSLSDYLVQNLTFDSEKSDEAQKALISSLSFSKGMVLSGQKIIDRGEIVDAETFDILMSLERDFSERNDSAMQSRTTLFGQLLYTYILMMGLALYFILFRRDYLASTRSILFLASMPVVFPLVTSFLIKHNLLSVYIIPFAMVPIFIRVFMDSRTAFTTHVVTVLICAVSLKFPFEFVATQIVAGLAAIYSLRELSQRSQLIRAAVLVTLASLLLYASIELIHERDFMRLGYNVYIYIVINGILLLFAYPIMFLFEKAFGFTSNVTLVELSNINNDLLRKMSEVAPGTFQHSMQVSNLAAAVANKIGAKAQLVRTGALYHDIGKINNPAYFTENQAQVNPHDQLTCEQSAAVIINHVKEGLRMAERYNLPQPIKDFIRTHHGLGKTKYFLISYKNQHPDAEVDESLYTYPGPNPFTQEQAILMMADAVEAASRSLNEYTEESISNLVDRLIDAQVQEGFFRACPITFQDINTAKEVFKDKLKTIYHTRISYPELRKM